MQGPYCAERDKRLLRAAKKRHLDAVDSTDWLSRGMPDTGSFLENLITTVMNNLQVSRATRKATGRAMQP